MALELKKTQYSKSFRVGTNCFILHVMSDGELIFSERHAKIDVWGHPTSRTALTTCAHRPITIFRTVVRLTLEYVFTHKPPFLYFKVLDTQRIELYRKLLEKYISVDYMIADKDWSKYCWIYSKRLVNSTHPTD